MVDLFRYDEEVESWMDGVIYNRKNRASHFFKAVKGCQMVCFETKNPNLGKLWKALEWKMLVNFMVIWNILQSLGIFYSH
jgi:hypothetical protein